MMPKNIEKNIYLRRRQGEVTILWYPKNTHFFVKVKLLWCHKKIGKNKYLRRPQGKLTLHEAKNTENVWCFVISLYYAAQNTEKIIYVTRRQTKITLLRYPKNTDSVWLFVKSTILWCPENIKKKVLKPWHR